MDYNKLLENLALLFAGLGSLNWGLAGLFDVNFIDLLLGAYPTLMQGAYALVALAGLWVLYALLRTFNK